MAHRWQWDETIAHELTARFRAWTDCNAAGNPAGLEEFLHDDFVYVSVFGARYDKASYTALAADLAPGAFYIVHRAGARLRDDVAELDGEYFTHSILSDGRDMSAHTRFTATWVREGDEWQCLTHHGSLYEPDGEVRTRMEALVGDRTASP